MDNKQFFWFLYVIGIVNLLFLGVLQVLSGIGAIYISKNPSLLKLVKEKITSFSIGKRELFVGGIFSIIVGILFSISGWGILNKKKKVLTLTLFLNIFLILLGIAESWGGSFNIVRSIIFVFYPAISVLYLTSKPVQGLFK